MERIVKLNDVDEFFATDKMLVKFNSISVKRESDEDSTVLFKVKNDINGLFVKFSVENISSKAIENAMNNYYICFRIDDFINNEILYKDKDVSKALSKLFKDEFSGDDNDAEIELSFHCDDGAVETDDSLSIIKHVGEDSNESVLLFVFYNTNTNIILDNEILIRY